jgi:hypothetical protein
MLVYTETEYCQLTTTLRLPNKWNKLRFITFGKGNNLQSLYDETHGLDHWRDERFGLCGDLAVSTKRSLCLASGTTCADYRNLSSRGHGPTAIII